MQVMWTECSKIFYVNLSDAKLDTLDELEDDSDDISRRFGAEFRNRDEKDDVEDEEERERDETEINDQNEIRMRNEKQDREDSVEGDSDDEMVDDDKEDIDNDDDDDDGDEESPMNAPKTTYASCEKGIISLHRNIIQFPSYSN